MNINHNFVIEIILEILLFPFIRIPLVLIFFIINTIFLIKNAYFLFSKSNENIILQDKTVDYKQNIENIMQISNVNHMVEKFFNDFNLDIIFLNQLLDNFNEKQKNEFIKTLKQYCHTQLSNTEIDIDKKNQAISILTIITKYKE